MDTWLLSDISCNTMRYTFHRKLTSKCFLLLWTVATCAANYSAACNISHVKGKCKSSKFKVSIRGLALQAEWCTTWLLPSAFSDSNVCKQHRKQPHHTASRNFHIKWWTIILTHKLLMGTLITLEKCSSYRIIMPTSFFLWLDGEIWVVIDNR